MISSYVVVTYPELFFADKINYDPEPSNLSQVCKVLIACYRYRYGSISHPKQSGGNKNHFQVHPSTALSLIRIFFNFVVLNAHFVKISLIERKKINILKQSNL